MQKLRVYPNPWKATDRDGLPCAVVPTDPEGDGGRPGQFVGARLDRKRTEVLQKLDPKLDLRSPMQRTRYQYQGIASDDPALGEKLFATEPVELPPTRYYKQRLREGALFAADKATAELARVRFVAAEDLAKRFATAPVMKAGAPPLSDGSPVGGFEPAEPGDAQLPDELDSPTFDAPSPKSKGGKTKFAERA